MSSMKARSRSLDHAIQLAMDCHEPPGAEAQAGEGGASQQQGRESVSNLQTG
jgi:hypothetical protein